MEDTEIPQKWPETKEKLLSKYPNLTPEDLSYEIGKEVDLLERLQQKLKTNWKDIKEVLALLG